VTKTPSPAALRGRRNGRVRVDHLDKLRRTGAFLLNAQQQNDRPFMPDRHDADVTDNYAWED
jgi:hypothetical protein